MSLGNLALLLQKRGDLDAAEPLMRQALAIRREAPTCCTVGRPPGCPSSW
jgi:hypothetical protein